MVLKFLLVVMVWGGIIKLGLILFVFLNGNIFVIKYCEILGEGLLLFNIVINDL